jgi:hypothetical protein
VLLDDACCGGDADALMSICFASDVLSRLDGDLPEEIVTVAEVEAWNDERRRDTVAKAKANAGKIVSLGELLDREPDPDPLWLERRRAEHPPNLD